MTSQVARQPVAEGGARMPVGTVYVVDPHPLNWLFITWNTSHAATLELAETEVGEGHWSRRDDG